MSRIRKLKAYMREASRYRGVFRQILDIVETKLRVNLGPQAYYFFEFYKRDLTWEQKSRYASNRGSRFWVFGGNPFKYQILFTDKFVQKAFLTGLDLPTPRLLGFIVEGGPRSSLSDFQDLIENAPNEFVLKVASGRGGEGFRRIVRTGDILHEGCNVVELEQLWEHISNHLGRGVVIEETAHNVESLRRLNPSSLNTFRVLTFNLPGAGWIHLTSLLKVGRSGSFVDNRVAGGLVVAINEKGQTGVARDFRTNTDYSRHPDSGEQLSGITIDGYKDVVRLALDASLHFPQLGILGWDIALTPKGPVIIEVNAAPGIDYGQYLYGGLVTDDMTKALPKKNLFSRYPKTHLYPNYTRSRKGRI